MIARAKAWVIWSPRGGLLLSTLSSTRKCAIDAYRAFWSEPMPWRKYRRTEGLLAIRVTVSGVVR